MEKDDKQCRALIGWIRFCALIFFLLITQGGGDGGVTGVYESVYVWIIL